MNEQHIFTKQKMVSLISQLIYGKPNPEDPHPPGPWDPFVYRALRRTAYALNLDSFGLGKQTNSRFTGYYSYPSPFPHDALEPSAPQSWATIFESRPELWRIIAERNPELWDIIWGGPLTSVALNPQPLPPRIMLISALATEVIKHALDRQEIADMMANEGEQRGIIVVGGYINRFIDEFCGTGIKLRFPIPAPPPPWFQEELSGLDLIVMGAQFQNAAKSILHEDLSKTFAKGADRLLEIGISRM